MQTLQLDIQDDKLQTFLTIIDNLKNGIVENIRFERDLLDIEAIGKSSEDYQDIIEAKNENNPKYSLNEAKAKLGLL